MTDRRRYVAFLRGMNLGGRRITNQELCGHFEALGLAPAHAFLASGNVVFESASAVTSAALEAGLEQALGYAVPTMLRTAEEIAALLRQEVFSPQQIADYGGKPQVAFLPAQPSAEKARAVLALATDRDLLELRGQELHWLPIGGISQSQLDFRFIDQTIGPTTVRTLRTVQRLAAKHFSA
ncbi:MAG: DUF1697 domain-containing protein [Acidobacteriota bacterium]